MRWIIQPSVVSSILVVSLQAAAADPLGTPPGAGLNVAQAAPLAPAAPGAPGAAQPGMPAAPNTEPAPASPAGVAPAAPLPPPAAVPAETPAAMMPEPVMKPEEKKAAEDAWQVSWSGYFRAPMMVGISNRGDPANINGPKSTQISYAPNRLVDANYSSFGFTRLQEGDWGEVYLTARKKHVAATVAFMGWWYTWGGYAQPKASWVPAQAFITLDTDFELGTLKPHIELKAGVFWQRWGMFGKYDTYMFGRFHQSGEALQLTLPVSPDVNLRFVHGLGYNRNGSSESGLTGATLLHYAHAGVSYKKMLDFGLYFNESFTKDPMLFTATPAQFGGLYADAKEADMKVFGADVKLDADVAGRVWLAGAHLKVKNGWALSEAVEIMHSPGGAGIANNYMGFGQQGSTGSGSMTNFSFLYENSLSRIKGNADAPTLPDLTLNLFGMMANTTRDLLAQATISEKFKQLKWGTDLTLTTLPWLAFMLRFDSVNLDLDKSGNTYMAFTPRVIFFTHFLSSESIWLQYTRYSYGDAIALTQTASQVYTKPDENVVKLQANISF